MDLTFGTQRLENLGAINVILGKNGIGKSELLRKIDAEFENQKQKWLVKYISPERGGELSFSASVEQNIRSGNWAISARRKNRVEQFRNMSFSEYRNLEVLVLRKIEEDRNASSFQATIDQINALLDNVKLVRGSKADIELRRKHDNAAQTAETLSSGETELLSIAIEILSYCHQAAHDENAGKSKLLLLDEPDVHLHPDLQFRLMKLIVAATAGKGITTIIATHSTALLGALEGDTARVAFMAKQQVALTFRGVSQQLRDIIPVFGAHPLTNVFNSMPILLVEGDDDARIWQQAVRSSDGRIMLWPCAAGDIQLLDKYESATADVIAAVYDDAKAYSLRDRDDAPYEIDDRPNVTRMRLFCRTSENLILSDDVLESLGLDWAEFKKRTNLWLENNDIHSQAAPLKQFAVTFDRVGANVKDLRILFMAIAGSSKPWEVAVGQAIAKLSANPSNGEGSLIHMLGKKVVAELKLCA